MNRKKASIRRTCVLILFLICLLGANQTSFASAKQIDIGDADVTLKNTSDSIDYRGFRFCEYDGNEKEVKIKYHNKTLIKGKDYSISYKPNNIGPGQVSVTVYP